MIGEGREDRRRVGWGTEAWMIAAATNRALTFSANEANLTPPRALKGPARGLSQPEGQHVVQRPVVGKGHFLTSPDDNFITCDSEGHRSSSSLCESISKSSLHEILHMGESSIFQ